MAKYTKTKTVRVPYLPNYGEDIMPIEWFEKNVKTFGKGLPPIKYYELVEIQGTVLKRFVQPDGSIEWYDSGHQAVYELKKAKDEPRN